MKTEIHNFKVGDTVTVFNRSFSKFAIEGKAKITAVWPPEDMYNVNFYDKDGKLELLSGGYRRFVDPYGQDDPEGYLAQLNANR
jgi:hypothetical protein